METYTTSQCDTFDQIALKEYGSELSTRDMMAVNAIRHPEYLLYWRFDAGVEITIPALTPSTSTVNELPVWRRSDD